MAQILRPLAAAGFWICAMAARAATEPAPALASDAAAPGEVSFVAAEPAPPVGAVVRNGLRFLQSEAYRWKGARSCAACHHAALVVWAFNEARAAGHAVDELALKEINEWSFTNMAANLLQVQPPPRDVIQLAAEYGLMSAETATPIAAPAAVAGVPGTIEADRSVEAEGAAPAPENPIPAARLTFIEQIVKMQKEDGSWGVPMDERVPLGGPVVDIAILSRIALLQSGDASTTVTACLDKAAEWLASHADNPSRQTRNFTLMMNLQEGKPAAELRPVVDAIKAEQNADGGWSQTPEMASDAYATGQTLFMLARAGVAREEAAMARGAEFLLRSQREDGSWPMISRVKAKDITPITAAGSAWAVIGLARAAK